MIPVARNNATSNAQGFSQALVTVASVDSSDTAICVDRYGRYFPPISTANMLGSGTVPQPGEVWMLDRSGGGWTFQSRVTANPPGVESVSQLLSTLADSNVIAANSSLPNYAQMGPMTGTITAVNNATATVSLTVGTTTYNNVAYASSYYPYVGDTALVEWSEGLGNVPFVVGSTALDNDVPIGATVGFYLGPATTQTYAAGTSTVGTLSTTLIAGHQYLVTLSNFQANKITNAGSGFDQIYARTSTGVLPNESSGLKAWFAINCASNAVFSGTGVGQTFSIGSTGTTVFTISIGVSTSSTQVGSNSVQLLVARAL